MSGGRCSLWYKENYKQAKGRDAGNVRNSGLRDCGISGLRKTHYGSWLRIKGNDIYDETK